MTKYTTREARLARCTFLWPGLPIEQRQELLNWVFRLTRRKLDVKLVKPCDFWDRLTAEETKLALRAVEGRILGNFLVKTRPTKEPSPEQRAAIAKLNAMMGVTN